VLFGCPCRPSSTGPAERPSSVGYTEREARADRAGSRVKTTPDGGRAARRDSSVPRASVSRSVRRSVGLSVCTVAIAPSAVLGSVNVFTEICGRRILARPTVARSVGRRRCPVDGL